MTDEELLSVAVKRLESCANVDRDNRIAAKNDLDFLIGEQWPQEVRTERENAGKPCLTINGLPQFVRQVTGNVRSMNPAIRVMAGDRHASKDTAEVIEGLIRQIEYCSDATTTYEETAATAAACGISYWRVLADYADPMSFDQEIRVERIHNPFAVFCDPLAKQSTRKDAQFAFIIDEMAADKFKEEYPDANASPLTSEHKATMTNAMFTWATADTVTVAEYYWIEYTDSEIYLLPDGRVVDSLPKGYPSLKKRKVKIPKVMWSKITQADVLEGPLEVPGDYIPIVAVTGEEWHVGESIFRSSVIRFAKDPQQLYNFARSTQAEVMQLQPRAPYMVTVKQIAGNKDMWENANQSNLSALVYTPDPLAPPPQRIPPPIASQALAMEVQMAGEDMKRTTGIYDASLGAQSNEVSGVAIRERKVEAQTNTSIYADNMVKGIIQTGKIIISMIPRVYDTARIIRILGQDDQEQMVAINGMTMTQDGPQAVNDMTLGKYDARISVGPSYESKRQEGAEGMMAFMTALPATAPFIADLIAGMQDWPDADRVQERLAKMLPPQLQDQQQQQDGQQGQQGQQGPSPQDIAQHQAMQQQQQQQAAQDQAMQAQAQQQAMQHQMDMAKSAAEIRKAEAQAVDAEAKAQKSQVEAHIAIAQLNAGIVPHTPAGAY